MAGLRKILLVDDNTQLIEIYRLYLAQNGFEVLTAIDGDEALNVAQANRPDLIFLDVMIPKKDGFEVLRILRHKPEYNCTKTKIVMLTNLGDASMVSPEVQEDMDGYVIKAEIQLKDLVDIISSFD